MRWFLLALACLISVPFVWGQTCVYPNGTCPANFSGVPQGQTTPSLIPNSAYTSPTTGVSTTGIDVVHGIVYNTSVGYAAPTGDVQSSDDITYLFPHECIASPNSCYLIMCFHAGGGYRWGTDYNGCFGDGTILQEAVFEIDRFLGVPNPVGNRIAVAMVNYRLAAAPPGFGTNNYPDQWQDGKCAPWYMLANPSVFPFNPAVIGIYGPSWGSILTYYAGATPDNWYTPACNASAPSTDPQYRLVPGWTPMVWIFPTGNSCWQNCDASFQDAIIGQMNSNSLPTVTTNCGSTLPTCDQGQNILLANIASKAALNNASIMFEAGATDVLVVPYWGSGSTQGGNVYTPVANFNQVSGVTRPFWEVIPNCGHTCDITSITAPSQIDAFNWLLRTNTGIGSGGLNGTMGN